MAVSHFRFSFQPSPSARRVPSDVRLQLQLRIVVGALGGATANSLTQSNLLNAFLLQRSINRPIHTLNS